MMGRKRLFAILILLYLCLLGACNDTAQEVPISAGTWHDHVDTNDLYVNEFMGIQFQLPNAWRGFTNEHLEYHQDFLEISMLTAPRLNSEMISINGDFTNEMVALNLSARPGTAESPPDAGTIQLISGRLNQRIRNRTPLDIFEVIFQRVPRHAREYTALDLLELIQNDLYETGITSFNLHETPVSIGRYEFYLLQTVSETSVLVPLERRIYLNLDADKQVRIIIVAGLTSEHVDEVMTYFTEPNAPLIQVQGALERDDELLDESELIGDWLWIHQQCNLHTFNLDFTGVQRHCNGFSRPFEWALYEGVLFLNFEPEERTAFLQIYQTALVDDTLTITSFYSPERVVETYIRGNSAD